MAKEEFLNQISMFLRFLLQATMDKYDTDNHMSGHVPLQADIMWKGKIAFVVTKIYIVIKGIKSNAKQENLIIKIGKIDSLSAKRVWEGILE